MILIARALKWFLWLIILGFVLGGLVFGVLVLTHYPKLPSVAGLADYKPKIPLRIYTADGVLMGEFGEERRAFVKIEQVPQHMKQAIVAAEDQRFYEHGGIDYMGVARAIVSNATGGVRSGASTITMQVAKNFYLSPEKTASRKFNEALLAYKIEKNYSKDQILELYFNQIFLGQRAYGFAAAGKAYFGKELDQLSIAEMAMLAGLPKAPSRYNPVVNFKRAKERQEYVLGQMLKLGFITAEEHDAAVAEVLTVHKKIEQSIPVHAEYVAEMARQEVEARYPDTAYTEGFKVYTTLMSEHQNAAYLAVRKAVVDYDFRHGYRGAEAYIEVPEDITTDEAQVVLDESLNKHPDADEMRAAVVLEADRRKVKAYLQGGELITIEGKGLKFAQAMLSSKANEGQRIRIGAIVRVVPVKDSWQIVQLPEVEAALVALDSQNGAVTALVGGFDFNRNHFNRVTQAWRQPGSSFKPFIYSAALERGFTPSTMINDAPLVLDPADLGGQSWEPKNYDGSFSGMISMRAALTYSKNLVSIRILQAVTPQYAQEYITRFGFNKDKHPAYLTMALGAGSVTPLEMAIGFAVFANQGFKVTPYVVQHIEDSTGRIVAKARPQRAHEDAVRTLDPRNAFVMTSMMQDVVTRGTATKVNALGRQDLAGKTGTTNDAKDTWFAGYHPRLVAVAWMGFDQPKSLGRGETGGGTAAPIWVDFMRKALKGVPESTFEVPEGVLPIEVGGRIEYVYEEFSEGGSPSSLYGTGQGDDASGATAPDSTGGGPAPDTQQLDRDTVQDALY